MAYTNEIFETISEVTMTLSYSAGRASPKILLH
jgi:hypothetical protein